MVRFHPRSLSDKVCKCCGSTRLWYGRRPGSIPGRTSDSNGLACSKGATDPCKISEKGSIPFRSTHFRKVAGYGLPGRTANARRQQVMRVQIPCLPLCDRRLAVWL